MIRKPMKAPSNSCTIEQLKNMQYPIVCSAKLDGIRGVTTANGILSNSLKPIGNEFIQSHFNDPALANLDGELIVGLPYADPDVPDDDVFNRTSGNVRRSSGQPNFHFYVFDDFTNPELSYNDRWLDAKRSRDLHLNPNTPFIIVLPQMVCHSFEKAMDYERLLIKAGYEGMMVRSIHAPYKQGRATAKEAYILKRKPLEQDEAVVVGVFEQMKNNNIKATNELGDSFRTAHKDNKEGKGTLGGVILQSSRWKENFNCGTIIGGTKEWRQQMWNTPSLIIGKTMTYVYQSYGSIDKPRQPRAKAEFRAASDLTDY